MSSRQKKSAAKPEEKKGRKKIEGVRQLGVIEDERISDTLERNFMPYAMSVIVSRAIPEIDGFKPSHRKLLYTMYRMGLLRGPRTKSANIVGQTMKLNPHGDQAIYETMVRLTRGHGALLHPYIDSKGNFGKQYSRDMAYAATRYTEARLAPICEELFRAIDRDAVDWQDNYDGTMREPQLLPATFPSVLVNQNQGIAVGMASNLIGFNLVEVCQAMTAYIDDPSFDIMELMPAPDFPGGGELLYDLPQMRRIFETGRGSVTLRARYRVDKKENRIQVYEIPYTTSVEAIINDLTNLVKANKLREVVDVRDETDLNGLGIAIDYRRTVDPDQLMTRLFLQTSLQSTVSANFNVLIDGRPQLLGVKGLMREWLIFRRRTLTREYEHELGQKRERLHLLRGLEAILLDIDKAIRIIRQTEREADVVPNLEAGFGIDRPQAEYVAEIRLRHLNREYILNRTRDIKSLEADIRLLERKLKRQDLIDRDIKADLARVAERYGEERRTQLVAAEEAPQLEAEDLIEDYRLRLFLTAEGYLKKLPLTSLRSAGDLRTKEGDRIIQDIEASNRQTVLLFTNRQTVYPREIHEIPDNRPSEMGAYTPNLLELEGEGEIVVHMMLAGDYSGELAFCFANGKGLRIKLDQYQTKTRRRRIVNAYSDRSPLVAIRSLPEPASFLIRSDDGKAALIDSELLPLMATRSSQGVQLLSLRKGRQATAFELIPAGATEGFERYRARKIPARGLVVREETLEGRQLDFETLLAEMAETNTGGNETK
ncbi:MAG: DNA topoisomerase (ATP-hydrolyzing) subunit A [Bacillota bacterium]|nr:DNA topoisomerase (ATP-hydrolyzing) subunit A [Bacillota bacterium]